MRHLRDSKLWAWPACEVTCQRVLNRVRPKIAKRPRPSAYTALFSTTFKLSLSGRKDVCRLDAESRLQKAVAMTFGMGMLDFPRVEYADSPDGQIAYQVLGHGPLDLVCMPGPRHNLDIIWEHPAFVRYMRRLASFSRVILLNARGTGLSDPLPIGTPPAFDEWVADLRWVLDAIGSDKAAIMGAEANGFWAMMFAATFPERTHALILIDAYATLRRFDDYPAGMPADVLERFLEGLASGWATGNTLQALAPEMLSDERFVAWWCRLERTMLSPLSFRQVSEIISHLDLRGVLSSVQAPTLAVAHTDSWIRTDHSKYLTRQIRDARYVEREGFWGVPWLHDVDGTIDEVQSFLTGAPGTPDLEDRVLATVLFVDIVGSTEEAARLGDKRWRDKLDDFESVVGQQIDRFRGRRIKSTGDGFLSTFEGPARAIRCAAAIREALNKLGIEVYTGLHTGEIELRGEDIGGIAVAIAARVQAQAAPGEIVVSHAVPPLVAGSEIQFQDKGQIRLKGVPGDWRLFRVETT